MRLLISGTGNSILLTRGIKTLHRGHRRVHNIDSSALPNAYGAYSSYHRRFIGGVISQSQRGRRTAEAVSCINTALCTPNLSLWALLCCFSVCLLALSGDPGLKILLQPSGGAVGPCCRPDQWAFICLFIYLFWEGGSGGCWREFWWSGRKSQERLINKMNSSARGTCEAHAAHTFHTVLTAAWDHRGSARTLTDTGWDSQTTSILFCLFFVWLDCFLYPQALIGDLEYINGVFILVLWC